MNNTTSTMPDWLEELNKEARKMEAMMERHKSTPKKRDPCLDICGDWETFKENGSQHQEGCPHYKKRMRY